MYHDLPRTARFWLFLLAVDQDLAETTRKQGCPCGGRLHCANYLRKPRGTPVQLPRATVPQTELLLRSRRLPEESDTAVGALPRSKGLPRRHRHPDQRHAAGADTTPGPRAVHTLRRRPADHRSLAGLLARTLSADTVLEDRTCPSGAGGRDRHPAVLARGCLPSRAIVAAGVGRSCCGFSHRSRSPEACESRSRDDRQSTRRRCSSPTRISRCIEVVTVPSPTL